MDWSEGVENWKPGHRSFAALFWVQMYCDWMWCATGSIPSSVTHQCEGVERGRGGVLGPLKSPTHERLGSPPSPGRTLGMQQCGKPNLSSLRTVDGVGMDLVCLYPLFITIGSMSVARCMDAIIKCMGGCSLQDL